MNPFFEGHCGCPMGAWGRLRVGYAAVMLRVLVPVSKPFVRLTAAAAAEGTEVALTCTVREGTAPLSFSWQHREPHGRLLAAPMGLGGSGAELLLAPANRSHAGWYACTARNEVNNRTSEPVYLDIVYGPDEPAISVEPFSPEQGSFSAGEREDVVLSCLAPSNPPSRYIWLHNGSQVHVGQTFVMSAIARGQAGTYTCLAENTHLQTRTQATIVLTVYYPPAGSPSCSAQATADLRDVALRCRWLGGFPPARLRWVGPREEETEEDDEEGAAGPSFSMATSIVPGAATRNGSSFACMAAHPALRDGAVCRTTLWIPAGSPTCMAAATKHDEYVMLRCRWEGGTPPATLRWWDGRGRALGVPTPSATVLVLSTDTSLRGQDFVCVAAHPLRAASTECRLRLDVPELEVERGEVAVQTPGEAGTGQHAVLLRHPWVVPGIGMPGAPLAPFSPGTSAPSRLLLTSSPPPSQRPDLHRSLPAEPPFEALPAVTGAAVMGMLVATSMSLLAVHYIARHRDRLPRLHELLFRMAGPDAPQLAEDANVAVSTEDGGQGQEEPGGLSTAAMEEEPRSAPPGDPVDDAPVDVSITVTAMP
ncbi:V-set and immunoglobulin domain-containing protein 10-like 2 [Meleagris gallopavo]|uniref:V-set and immunoglobulin domain-containing protein 10-like 2 n=1 Tax=Meleagris gallopavo TaxID=9103 RepID=UPI0012ABBFA8|nr:V-set and immunoglobulin domain-containing protein 10-like 2 [Meleagris gallopavo]